MASDSFDDRQEFQRKPDNANCNRDSLITLGQRLVDVLERPETSSIGTFSAIVERLHAELSMVRDPALANSNEGAADEDWEQFLATPMTARQLTENETEALGGFLAHK